MSETIYQKCAIRARDCIRKGKARHKDIGERHNVKKENGKDREIKKSVFILPAVREKY